MNITKKQIGFIALAGLLAYLLFRPKKSATNFYRLKEDFSRQYSKGMQKAIYTAQFKKGQIIEGKRNVSPTADYLKPFGKESIGTTTNGKMPTNFKGDEGETIVYIPESILEPIRKA